MNGMVDGEWWIGWQTAAIVFWQNFGAKKVNFAVKLDMLLLLLLFLSSLLLFFLLLVVFLCWTEILT